MPSENNIKWEGILSEYQLKDPLNLSERPDGSSVSISFAGKHASEFLFATVQNGKLNGSALIKDRLQRRVLNFVFVNNSISGPSRLTFSDFMMSEEGEIHFEEVKRIFLNIEYASFVLVPLTLLLTAWQIRKKNAPFFAVLSAFPTFLVLIVGSLVALNWDFCFVLFHKILFRNDYWIFDPACDPVITILPDAYFLHAAALILLCVLAASLFSLLLFRLLRRKISNSAK